MVAEPLGLGKQGSDMTKTVQDWTKDKGVPQYVADGAARLLRWTESTKLSESDFDAGINQFTAGASPRLPAPPPSASKKKG